MAREIVVACIPIQEGLRIQSGCAWQNLAILCADFGVIAEPRDGQAAYLATWLDVLKRASVLFSATAHA